MCCVLQTNASGTERRCPSDVFREYPGPFLCSFFWSTPLLLCSSIVFILRHIIVVCLPFRTAVPFWGHTTQNLSGLSPQWECGAKRGLRRRQHVWQIGVPVDTYCTCILATRRNVVPGTRYQVPVGKRCRRRYTYHGRLRTGQVVTMSS